MLNIKRKLSQKGFSLIELMVAVVILVMAIFGIFLAFSTGFQGMADARDRTVATNYLQEKIEDFKNMNFNKAIIAGNLTRDPEIRSLPSGQQVANFGVASNRYYTDQQGNKQEKAEFHNVVAFGKLADICSKYLKKGMLILVEGRIQTSNWEGKENGC